MLAGPGKDSDQWRVVRARYAYNARGPRPTITHHSSCFIAPGPAELTTAEAGEPETTSVTIGRVSVLIADTAEDAGA